jgi:hypothetical protein
MMKIATFGGFLEGEELLFECLRSQPLLRTLLHQLHTLPHIQSLNFWDLLIVFGFFPEIEFFRRNRSFLGFSAEIAIFWNPDDLTPISTIFTDF